MTNFATKCSNYSIVSPIWDTHYVCPHPKALKEWKVVKTLCNFF